MERLDFNDFYEKVIVPFWQELKVLDKDYGCLSFRPNRKWLIYYHYEEKRKELRKQYMEPNPNLALDRHKVASCMLYALLRSRCIKIKKSIPNLPVGLLLANEHLALVVALNIVEMYKREDEEWKDSNYSITIPSTYHDSGESSEFINNTIKALSYIRSIKHFDVFAYSTILFLLENRTDLLIKHEIQE